MKQLNIYKLTGIILVIFAIVGIAFQLGSHFEKEITITKKYTAVTGVRYARTQYMVVDSDNSIYEVSNVWWKADFNNVEDWNNMEVGKKYRVKGWGYRFPLFGMYPNIYELVE
jgi:hypothetical protein